MPLKRLPKTLDEASKGAQSLRVGPPAEHIFRLALGFLSVVLAFSVAAQGKDGSDSRQHRKSSTSTRVEPKAQTTQEKRPAFQNVRSEEDWSGQRGSEPSYKYIPLGDDGWAFLSLGGQIRLRTELWDNFGLLDGPGRDDVFGISRLRLHGDLYLGKSVRVFVEGKSSLISGRDLPGGVRTLDADSVALQNALVDITPFRSEDSSLTLRVGRQELQFGKQRLVSPLDWSNTRPRSFDAVRAIFKTGAWRLDAFAGNATRFRKYDFNSRNPDADFFGAYLAGKLPDRRFALDLYWLGLGREGTVFGGLRGRERRHTIGGRLGGALDTWDFDLESAFQFGTQAGRDIRAYMVSTVLGRTFDKLTGGPRVSLGFDYASGDGDPSNGKLGTFNHLFPLGHAYFGFIDLVGRQNIIDLAPGATWRFHPRLTTKLDGHFFWRAQERDALYNAGGGVVRRGFPGSPKRVGSEIDLTVRYAFRRPVVVVGGVSRFFAGPFARETGGDDDTTFGYLTVQYTF